MQEGSFDQVNAEKIFNDMFTATLEVVRNACSALEAIIEEERRGSTSTGTEEHAIVTNPHDDLLRVWERTQDTILEVLQGLLEIDTEPLSNVNARTGFGTASFSLGFKGMDSSSSAADKAQKGGSSHTISSQHYRTSSAPGASDKSESTSALTSRIASLVGSGYELAPYLYRSLCEFAADGRKIVVSVVPSEPSKSLKDYIERFITYIFVPTIKRKHDADVKDAIQHAESVSGESHGHSQALDTEYMDTYGHVIRPVVRLHEVFHQLIMICRQLPTYADEVFELLENLASAVFDCNHRLYKRILERSAAHSVGFTIPENHIEASVSSEVINTLNSAAVSRSDSKGASVVVDSHQLTNLAVTFCSFKNLRDCQHHSYTSAETGSSKGDGYLTMGLAERGAECTRMASLAFSALQYEVLFQLAMLFGPMLHETSALWRRSITLDRLGASISELCAQLESEVAPCLDLREQQLLVQPVPAACSGVLARVLHERRHTDDDAGVEPLVSTVERAMLPLETLGGKGWLKHLRHALEQAKGDTSDGRSSH